MKFLKEHIGCVGVVVITIIIICAINIYNDKQQKKEKNRIELESFFERFDGINTPSTISGYDFLEIQTGMINFYSDADIDEIFIFNLKNTWCAYNDIKSVFESTEIGDLFSNKIIIEVPPNWNIKPQKDYYVVGRLKNKKKIGKENHLFVFDLLFHIKEDEIIENSDSVFNTIMSFFK